jgi:hypothetical protein
MAYHDKKTNVWRSSYESAERKSKALQQQGTIKEESFADIVSKMQ